MKICRSQLLLLQIFLYSAPAIKKSYIRHWLYKLATETPIQSRTKCHKSLKNGKRRINDESFPLPCTRSQKHAPPERESCEPPDLP